MAALLPHEQAAVLARIDRIAELMDSRFRLPGTNIRVGWDAIGGLVPVAGDVVTFAVAAWLVAEASRFKLRAGLLARMAGNVALDALIGAVPVVGSLFDVFFRANDRNVRLLLSHIEASLLQREAAARHRHRRDRAD